MTTPHALPNTLAPLRVLALLALCGALHSAVARASDYAVTAASMDSHCNLSYTQGYYLVEKDGNIETVFVWEDPGIADGDRLPDMLWCPGGTPLDISAASTNTVCSKNMYRLEASTHGCKFDIDVWAGSASDDTVACTSSDTNPVLLFGLGGADDLQGTSEGDFIHGGDGADEDLVGGDGSDYICGGDGADTIYGGAHGDILWGGRGMDTIYGEGGPDTIQGAGSNEGTLSGGGGNDNVHGGGGNGTLEGGEGDDWLHGGNGTESFDGGADDDLIFSFDVNSETSVVGGSGTDVCFSDTGDTLSGCTLEPRSVSGLDHPLVVGTRGSGDAVLWELDADGSTNSASSVDQWGPVWNSGEGEYATEIIALAISPEDDTLFAVVDFPARSDVLVSIDLASEPTVVGGSEEYASTEVLDFPSDIGYASDVVDIAFDSEGVLSVLYKDTHWQRLAVSIGSATELASADIGRQARWSFSPQAFHMAFDGPDSGFLLITTRDPNPDGDAVVVGGVTVEDEFACMDALHPTGSPTELSMPLEDHIRLDKFGDAPFTFTHLSNAGEMLVIDSSEKMWRINRLNMEILPWTLCVTQCTAQYTSSHTLTAITMPHRVN